MKKQHWITLENADIVCVTPDQRVSEYPKGKFVITLCKGDVYREFHFLVDEIKESLDTRTKTYAYYRNRRPTTK